MCKELSEELQNGSNAAIDLAKHVDRMGAGNFQRVVLLGDAQYKITVVREFVLNESENGKIVSTVSK